MIKTAVYKKKIKLEQLRKETWLMSNYVKTKLKTIYKKIIINLFNLIYIRPTKKIKNKDDSEKVYNLKINVLCKI